jgi:hypothetical protein
MTSEAVLEMRSKVTYVTEKENRDSLTVIYKSLQNNVFQRV